MQDKNLDTIVTHRERSGSGRFRRLVKRMTARIVRRWGVQPTIYALKRRQWWGLP